MKLKNIILLSILAFLVVLTWLVKNPYEAKEKEVTETQKYFSEINSQLVDKIIFKQKDGENELRKNDDGWELLGAGDFKVDDDLINNLLNSLSLSTTSLATLISNDEEQKSIYGLDEKNAKTLQVWQGDKKVLDILVGNHKSGKTYFCETGKPGTFEIISDISASLTESDWRNKIIFEATLDKIKELKINSQKTKKELQLTYQNDNWFVKNSTEKLNNDKVNLIVGVMTSLRASLIPKQELKDTGLEDPLYKIELLTEKSSRILIVGKQNGSNYYAKTLTNNNIYLIDKSQVELFNTEIAKLK